MSWIDASGNLWLFGGHGYASGGGGYGYYFNDLWKFDPALGTYGEWTWMGGSDVVNQSGVYGTPGTAVPGGRSSAASWIDGAGNLWLSGGYGFDSMGTLGSHNDLWKFDPTLGTMASGRGWAVAAHWAAIGP